MIYFSLQVMVCRRFITVQKLIHLKLKHYTTTINLKYLKLHYHHTKPTTLKVYIEYKCKKTPDIIERLPCKI